MIVLQNTAAREDGGAGTVRSYHVTRRVRSSTSPSQAIQSGLTSNRLRLYRVGQQYRDLIKLTPGAADAEAARGTERWRNGQDTFISSWRERQPASVRTLAPNLRI